MNEKNLQLKYTVLWGLYWFAGCIITGFPAIFLRYKGLSSTMIGITTGGACMLNIFLSPILMSVMNKSRTLNEKKVLYLLTGFIGIAYLLMAFAPMPRICIMALYILLFSASVSSIPFISDLGMNLIRSGENLNYGSARGIGSFAYALTGILMGRISDSVSPLYFAPVLAAVSFLLILCIRSIPETETEEKEERRGTGFLQSARKYPSFLLILTGFAFIFAGFAMLGTYMIDIVKSHGGSDTMYGIIIFCMAASEVPVMALCAKLLKKTGSTVLLMAAAFFFVVRNGVIAFSLNNAMVISGIVFQSFSYALFTGVIAYYVAYYLDHEDQIAGQTMIAVMTTGIGQMAGNLIGGILMDSFGLKAMCLCAFLLTLTGALIVILPNLRKRH